MEAQSWLCSACHITQASMFCLCEAGGMLFCQSCLSSHFIKTPGRSHSVHPIAAFPYKSIPGYFDRLQQRSAAVSLACAELTKNLGLVDKCMEELNQAGERVIERVRVCMQGETEKLVKLREEMKKEIEEAVAEVEGTLYEDEPKLKTKYGERLRTYRGEMGELRLFDYLVEIADLNLSSIFRVNYLSEESQYCILPRIHGNSLICYDLITGQSTTATLSLAFSDYTMFCLISPDTVLCAGWLPINTSSYLLNLTTKTVVQQQAMRTARFSPGIIKHGFFVYVFGGGAGQAYITESEKFSITSKSWSPIPNMRNPRGYFTPCQIGDEVYLPSLQQDHKVLETFNVKSEEFKIVPVSLGPFQSSYAVAFAIDRELFVLTSSKQMGRLRINTDSGFVVTGVSMNNGSSCCSNIPPVQVGRRVLWVRWSDGALVTFNCDSKTLID